MINCWHKPDGEYISQTQLVESPMTEYTSSPVDITVPVWLRNCEITATVFDYTADTKRFPPCVNFFGNPLQDIVYVLSIAVESAEDVFSDEHFIYRSLCNISTKYSGLPRGANNTLPIAWIGIELHDDRVFVNNNQLTGHLRGVLNRKSVLDIHRFLVDFVATRHGDLYHAHYSAIANWIQTHGRPGQKFMQFPYSSRVMRGCNTLEYANYRWYFKPASLQLTQRV